MGSLFWRVREAVVAADVAAERVVLWNPAAERLFGYRAEEAIGMPLEALVPDRLREAHRAGIARYRASGSGSVVDADAAIEVPALRKDGIEVPVELTLASAEAADGGGRYVVAVIRDASERVRAAEEHARLLREQAAREEAEAALRLMDEFVAVAAHELKTPATVLRLTAQVALRRVGRSGALPPEAGRAFETIDAHAARLGILAAQLLDAARLQAGTMRLELTDTDAASIVRQAVQRLPPADRARVTVDAPDAVPVRADPERLQQVVVGLLENAVKFSPAETPIGLSAQTAGGGGAAIEVRDRGPGVPPQARARLFERFHRGDPEAHAPGMGLGLYLGRRLAELMGGALEAAFPPEGGTVMTLRLPRHPVR